MNPLTLVKRTQEINAKEAALGISEDASWHAKYKESAYVFVGGIPFELTEGDILAVFAQYGEIVDVNLVRDKGTGKSKGFAFVAYEDQRSTNLAVDNLNGASVSGRIIRVDHCEKYKKKEEEDEEAEQKKREERGVCRAFQKGECTRGAGCRFSHDEQRAANTGWGEKDDRPSKRGEEAEQKKREERGVCRAFQKGECTRGAGCRFSHDEQRAANTGWGEKDDRPSKRADGRLGAEYPARNERQSGFPVRVTERHYDRGELGSRDERLEGNENRHRNRNDRDDSNHRGRKSYENEPNLRGERERRDEKRSRKDEPESYHRGDRDSRGKDRSACDSSDGRRTSDKVHRSRSDR